MAQTVKLKRSSVVGNIPTTANLELGEVAINTADGKLYFERGDSTVQAIVTTNTTSPITGSLNLSGSITIIGNVSGSSISTGSFGKLLGDGTQITGITATSAPAGADRDVQFNDNGVTGADTGDFTYNKTTNTLYVASVISGSSTSTGSFGHLKTAAYRFPSTDGNEAQVLVTDGLGNVTFGYGERLQLQVRNDELVTLPIGTPIYSKGSIGGSNRILVGKADASNSSKLPSIGLLTQELTTAGGGKDGYAITSGVFIADISGFSGLNINDKVYVAAGGGLTNIKPITSSNLIQNVGVILKTNGTTIQSLKVSAIDRTNDIPNLPTGKIWVGDSLTVTSSIITLDEVNRVAQITGSMIVSGSITSNGTNVIDNAIAMSIALG